MAKKIEQQVDFHGSNIKTVAHGKLPDTPIETIDRYLDELKAHQLEWAQLVPISERIKMLETALANIDAHKEEWAQRDIKARHIPEGHMEIGNSYVGGPGEAAAATHAVLRVMRDLEKHGGTKNFAKARQDGDRVVVDSFPATTLDKLAFAGITSEIHLKKGTKLEDLPSMQAKEYKDKNYEGGVSLILVAGNVSALAVTDLYEKLLNEKKVVIIKVHPVLEYMGDILEKIFEPFVSRGFLKIVIGGSVEGHHLTNHPLVDDIHITGSDKTFDAIVYGGGEQGIKNKENDHRLNDKPVTGELGNVTPVIVIPGDWKDADYDYQADNIFSMLSIFNGYTCVTARVLILPKDWDGSAKLVAKLQEKMADAPIPVNYYPGTNETIETAFSCYPDMKKYGELTKHTQPWMLAANVNAGSDEMAFKREFWSSFLAQTHIEGKTPEEYLNNAVQFANEKLWGTLAAVLIVDPITEKSLKASGALRKAIDDLRYGTVSINIYSGFAIVTSANPWGGYPGSTYTDIQSGNGFVANTCLLDTDKIEKSVFRAPFRISPKPIWFPTKKPNIEASKIFMDLLISQKLKDFGRLLWSVIRH